MYSLKFRRPDVRNQGVPRAILPPKHLRRDISFPFPVSDGHHESLAFFGLWQHNFCLCLRIYFYFYLCVHSSSYKDTSILDLGPS